MEKGVMNPHNKDDFRRQWKPWMTATKPES